MVPRQACSSHPTNGSSNAVCFISCLHDKFRSRLELGRRDRRIQTEWHANEEAHRGTRAHDRQRSASSRAGFKTH